MTITTGVITSPDDSDNPGFYPLNLDRTEYVEVESGKILRLEFTAFAVYVGGNMITCPYDFVRITDGDGTTLMDNSCGFSNRNPSSSYFFQPPIIMTKTNKVEIYFHTSDSFAKSGWNLTWAAMAEGSKYSDLISGTVRFCQIFFQLLNAESPKLILE